MSLAPLEYQPQFRLAACVLAADNNLARQSSHWHLEWRDWQQHEAERGKPKARVKAMSPVLALAIAGAAMGNFTNYSNSWSKGGRFKW
jgi:hypothetical protein